MKTNHRRQNKGKYLVGYDYGHLNFIAQAKAGLGYDHDGGHKGAARDRREQKAIRHRQERRKLNKLAQEDTGEVAELA